MATYYYRDTAGRINISAESLLVQGVPITSGPPGPQGPIGPEGPQGDQGDTGDTGAQGPAGAQGAQGATGPQGATGAQGSTGAQGAQGATGPQGLNGPQGNPGTNGLDATMSSGVVTTGAPGSSVIYSNVGTPSTAVWDVTIPRGDVGATGPAGAAGSGETAYLPIGTWQYPATKTEVVQVNGNFWGQAILRFSVSASGDHFQIKFAIQAGTYALTGYGATGANQGIWTAQIDGAGPTFDVDTYTGATGTMKLKWGDFTFPTSGNYVLNMSTSSKNGASSGYHGYWHSFTFHDDSNIA